MLLEMEIMHANIEALYIKEGSVLSLLFGKCTLRLQEYFGSRVWYRWLILTPV